MAHGWKMAAAAFVGLVAVAAARQAGNADEGLAAWGQEAPDQPLMIVGSIPAPATLLEADLRNRGVVVTASYSEPLTIPADEGGSIRISVLDVKSKLRRQAGLMVEVRNKAGQGATTYIDQENIGELLDALPQLGRVERAGSPLPFVAARYATKGGLAFVNADINGSRMVRVTATQILDTGRVVISSCTLGLGSFSQATQQFAAAERKLAGVKQQ